MEASRTMWLELLAPLRERLTGRDHRGNRGSLRWFEALMTEQGGRAGAVRNILYKDLGSFEEKTRFFDIMCSLYEQLELARPPLPENLTAARAKQLLGSDKRAIFSRFVRSFRAEEKPQLVVVGGPATGKNVLLEQVRQGIDEHLFMNVGKDLAPGLYAITEPLGLTETVDQLIAQLSPNQPYALQASLQDELRQLLVDGLNEYGVPLLLRAGAVGKLGGLALRGPDSAEVDLSSWWETVLMGLTIPYLAALTSAPPSLPYRELRRPNHQESRRYLRQKLPQTSDSRIEVLLNQAGHDYGELSRMALLEMSREGGDGSNARLLQDPFLGPLLEALAALSPESDPLVPVDLLEKVLGRSLEKLNLAQRTLFEWSGKDKIRPAIRSLLPAEGQNPRLHARALEYYRDHGNAFRQLYHSKHSGSLDELLALLRIDPSRLSLLPGLWEEARSWSPGLREELAPIVLRQRAVLGDYEHPEVREAIDLLLASEDDDAAAWALLKKAEAYIDSGRFDEASSLMVGLPRMEGDARAERLLVEAALERWQGEYERAEQMVQTALTLDLPPLLLNRARLWQGLVAKDAGRFEEAMDSLTRVSSNPLLRGRARYQQGDLLIRLGELDSAAQGLEDALRLLEPTASAEEVCRVRARLASTFRRLGRFTESAEQFGQALEEAPDQFTRERVASEASVLEAARGRSWEAIQLASQAEEYFRSTGERPEEARYRRLRSLFRLGIAYAVTESGRPFCPPFRHSCSNAQARGQAEQLLRPLLETVRPLAGAADRYASLYTDVAVVLSQVVDPAEAVLILEPLVDVPQEYLRRDVRLAMAGALNKRGDYQKAMLLLAGLRNLPPDPGLTAWKAALEAETLLLADQSDVAYSIIEESMVLPAVFLEQFGRVWGEILLEAGCPERCRTWLNECSPLALPDALALNFRQRFRPEG